MKLTHKLGGAVLVAVAGVALAIPNTTKATDSAVDGTGKITFTYDATGTIPIVDPENTDSTATTITGGLSSQNPGEMGIIAVTPLEFGGHKSITSTKVYDYYAKPFVANPNSNNEDDAVIASNTQKFETAHFVTFQDFRPNQNHDYTISAKITSQFTAKGEDGEALREITGAKLTYNNVSVVKADQDDSYTVPKKLNTGVEVKFGESTTVVENLPVTVDNQVTATGNAGYGRFNLVFGTMVPDASTSKKTAEESVKLTVPSSTVVTAGEYSAVVKWTMSDTI